jgi:hypothetical protein
MSERELGIVFSRYGSDRSPSHATNRSQGSDWLLYHNESHSRHVRNTAKSLARELATRGMIESSDVPLVELAGAFHDHEQGVGPGANERMSADAALAAMRQHPDVFSSRDMERVEDMIMGTTVTIEGGSLHQAARHDDLLQACVADADLSALAAPDGVATGLRLFCEGEVKAGRMTPPRSAGELRSITADPRAVDGFLRFQLNLLTEHDYLLDISSARYASGIERNAQLTQELLSRNATGATFADLYGTALDAASISPVMERSI